MQLRNLFLMSALALSQEIANAQQNSAFELAVECAGMSAAMSSGLGEKKPNEPKAMRELRQIVTEVNDNSYKRANDLGEKAGLSPSDVAKKIVPPMLGNMQLPGDQLWSSVKLKCIKPFLSPATLRMMRKRSS